MKLNPSLYEKFMEKTICIYTNDRLENKFILRFSI